MFLHYYAAQLRKGAEARRAHPSQPSSLRDRFVIGTPRCQRFLGTDVFLCWSRVALKTQGRYISPVLLELRWQRKRVWSTTGQYHRYWLPPTRAD